MVPTCNRRRDALRHQVRLGVNSENYEYRKHTARHLFLEQQRVGFNVQNIVEALALANALGSRSVDFHAHLRTPTSEKRTDTKSLEPRRLP